MKIAKGHYVPKELIMSEAVHEAVVKCFVAAGMKKLDVYGNYGDGGCFNALSTDCTGIICWSCNDGEPLTLQQLFTAENALHWPENSYQVVGNEHGVWFCCDDHIPVVICGAFESNSRHPVIAYRQPKEKEVNKVQLIDKAIHKHSGIWPSPAGNILHVAGTANDVYEPFSEFDFSSQSFGSNDYWIFLCERKDFERRAKELGYINGYRWGVEYPTNGKRPELADDVAISVKTKIFTDWQSRAVCEWNWDAVNNPVKSFKIIDYRHMPADTSYLNAPTQTQSLTHSEEGLTHGDWFDYEMHKAVNPAPVGTKLIVDCFDKDWKDAVVIGSFERWNWIDIAGIGLETVDLCRIKPLDHATRKAELERKELIQRAKDALPDDAPMIGDWNTITWIIERLVDTGVIRK